jgi:thiol-disulfide isomerase/thioredoxin
MAKSNATNLRSVLIPVFLIALCVAVLTTLLLRHEKKMGETKENIEIRVGTELPDFDLADLDGKTTKFSRVKKKITVLNFWATWCGPCVEEIPSLNRLREKFKAEGLEVIGVNMDDDPGKVLPAFFKKIPVEFPTFVDPEGVLADKLSVGGLPFSAVIDDENRVLFTELGERDWMSSADQNQFRKWLNPHGG